VTGDYAQERRTDGSGDSKRRRGEASILLHFYGNAPWSDAAMLAGVGKLVLPAIERSGPIEAWIIDDTGFPRRGDIRSGDPAILRSTASRTTARSRCHCHWPITMPVCQSRIGSIF
jgi:hypothetical protein